jgi:hypothetical protein
MCGDKIKRFITIQNWLWLVSNVEHKLDMSSTVKKNGKSQQVFYNSNKLKKLHDLLIGVGWVNLKVHHA